MAVLHLYAASTAGLDLQKATQRPKKFMEFWRAPCRPSGCLDGHGLQAPAWLWRAAGDILDILDWGKGGNEDVKKMCSLRKACTTAALNYIDVAKGIANIYSSGMPQAVELPRCSEEKRDEEHTLYAIC